MIDALLGIVGGIAYAQNQAQASRHRASATDRQYRRLLATALQNRPESYMPRGPVVVYTPPPGTMAQANSEFIPSSVWNNAISNMQGMYDPRQNAENEWNRIVRQQSEPLDAFDGPPQPTVAQTAASRVKRSDWEAEEDLKDAELDEWICISWPRG